MLEVWNTETAEPRVELVETEAARASRRGESLLDPAMEQQVRNRVEAALRGPAESTFMTFENPVGTLAFSHESGRAVSAVTRNAKYSDAEEPPYLEAESETPAEPEAAPAESPEATEQPAES